MAEAGFEEGEGGGSVVAEVEGGLLHGLADFGGGGEVHDSGEAGDSEELVEQVRVGDRTDHKAGGGGNGFAAAAREVVEYGNLETALEEETDSGSADVACAAGDENVFGHLWPNDFRLGRDQKNSELWKRGPRCYSVVGVGAENIVRARSANGRCRAVCKRRINFHRTKG